jgi:hypothetical protein
MEKNKDEYFLEIFTQLMRTHYPDCEVFENPNPVHRGKMNMFSLDSKNMVIEVLSPNFYFYLDPTIKENVKGFNKNASNILIHSVGFLGFHIQLTAGTGKTYSYPNFKNYLGASEQNVFMQATYIFTCINYTIMFFESSFKK